MFEQRARKAQQWHEAQMNDLQKALADPGVCQGSGHFICPLCPGKQNMIEELQRQLRDAQGNIHELTQRNEQLTRQAANSDHELSSHIAEHNRDANSANSIAANMRARLQSTEQNASGLQEQVLQLQARLEQSARERTLEEQRLGQQNADLVSQLNNTQQQLPALSSGPGRDSEIEQL